MKQHLKLIKNIKMGFKKNSSIPTNEMLSVKKMYIKIGSVENWIQITKNAAWNFKYIDYYDIFKI